MFRGLPPREPSPTDAPAPGTTVRLRLGSREAELIDASEAAGDVQGAFRSNGVTHLNIKLSDGRWLFGTPAAEWQIATKGDQPRVDGRA